MLRTFPARAAGLAALVLSVSAFHAAGAAAATPGFEAESMSLPSGAGMAFGDSSASGGQALQIWSNATATATYSTSGVRAISVRAKGDQCAGAPQIKVSVDGTVVMSRPVNATGWTEYGANLPLADGAHKVSVAFTNDYSGGGCDRNLRVDRVAFYDSARFEAESASLPSSNGAAFSDSSASGGRALLIWSNGRASQDFTTTGVRSITVRARGDQCAGAPQMTVTVDGTAVLSAAVPATSWTDYTASAAVADGPHSIGIAFTNDYSGGGCDRNLRVDRVTLGSAAGNPVAGAKWYIDPNSNAARQAAAWRSTRPADASEMDKIAGQPQADWFGDWSGDITSAVGSRVSTIAAAGALPVLVAYNIPERDCGSFSSGGAGSADAYRTWIRGFAAGIGTHRAVVVLEPDALAGMDCLSAADQDTRVALLRDAVSVLASHAGVLVYLDAGNATWHTAADTASRLVRAGVDQAQGFSLNVSNMQTTSSLLAYGDAVSGLAGGKHFLIDTSRNGLGPTSDGQTCNPPGRALGARPTTATGDPLADLFFWVKRPGESDGTCNGGPAAGQWWASYALGLAQRAAY
ncbi:MAG TPA: glycoside hydrolase family 6 protein [Thermoleophilaceae bacterium]